MTAPRVAETEHPDALTPDAPMEGPVEAAPPRAVFEDLGLSEPLLRALMDGNAGIETLSIERPGLHDAFVAIAGAAAAEAMGKGAPA